MDYPLEGKIGVVAGWGKTDNSFGKTGTNLLNKVGFIKFQRFRIYPASMKVSCETPAQMPRRNLETSCRKRVQCNRTNAV